MLALKHGQVQHRAPHAEQVGGFVILEFRELRQGHRGNDLVVGNLGPVQPFDVQTGSNLDLIGQVAGRNLIQQLPVPVNLVIVNPVFRDLALEADQRVNQARQLIFVDFKLLPRLHELRRVQLFQNCKFLQIDDK